MGSRGVRGSVTDTDYGRLHVGCLVVSRPTVMENKPLVPRLLNLQGTVDLLQSVLTTSPNVQRDSVTTYTSLAPGRFHSQVLGDGIRNFRLRRGERFIGMFIMISPNLPQRVILQV